MIPETIRERLTNWGWDTYPLETVERAHTFLETWLDIEIKYSPSVAGTMLIESTHPFKTRRYLRKCQSDLSIVPRLFDLQWCRRLNLIEQSALYLYSFDRNGMYLASTPIYLGAGDYRYDPTGQQFEKNSVGFWRARFAGKSEWNHSDLPDPTSTIFGYDEEAVVATATINLARNLGYQIDIIEGWHWPERARILEGFHDKLQSALRAIVDSNWPADVKAAARNGVKRIYTQTIGFISSDKFDTRRWSYRPDWRALIISEARARLFYNLRALVDAGFKPCAVLTDEIFFASNNPNQLAAVPVDLGKYKSKRALTMDCARAAFSNGDARELLQAMNKLTQQERTPR